MPNDPARLAARGRPVRRRPAHPGAGLLHGLPRQHLLQQRPVQRELLHGLGTPSLLILMGPSRALGALTSACEGGDRRGQLYLCHTTSKRELGKISLCGGLTRAAARHLLVRKQILSARGCDRQRGCFLLSLISESSKTSKTRN